MLARRPKLLVLDEPTTGLDPVARHEILRELTDVMADEGRSILFSSHNTQDVEQISDQITFIDRGRIIDSMDKESLPRSLAPPAPGSSVGSRSCRRCPESSACGRSGRLAVATSNAFVPDLANAYENYRRPCAAHREHDARRDFCRQRGT